MSPLFILFLITSIVSVRSVPVPSSNETTTQKQEYDLTQFDEVHDQRQNGTENWRVNLDKIVLVYSPPGGLLTAALLADSGLWGDEFNNEDFFSKPDEITVIKPEATTKKPEENAVNMTETTTNGGITTSSSAPSIAPSSLRRRLRIPGFLRPFMKRQHSQQ